MVVSALKNELGGDVFAHLEPDPVGHSGHEILSGPIIATKGVVSTVNAKDLTFTVKSKAGDESFKVTETAVVKAGSKTISLGELRAGDHVQVSYTGSGSAKHVSEVAVLTEAKAAKNKT